LIQIAAHRGGDVLAGQQRIGMPKQVHQDVEVAAVVNSRDAVK
jgi:hypothetical protein